MSYQITISGHSESKKGEAAALTAAVECAEKIGANGAFGFTGGHFSILVATPEVGLGRAHQLLDAYNAGADADDQVVS